MRFKLLAFLTAVITAAAFCGCSGTGYTPPAVPTEAAEETSRPMATVLLPNPDYYVLGENGRFENDIFTVNFPSFLEFSYFNKHKNPVYTGEYNDQAYALSFVTDRAADYEAAFANADFDSFGEYIAARNGSGCVLKEFSRITVDGHDAVVGEYSYSRPDHPDETMHSLQYCINVDGWVLSITIGTLDEQLADECRTFIDTMRFKADH